MPDGRYETEVGWLDDDGVNRGVQAAGQGRRRDRGRRDHVRPDRLERRGADGLQLPVRGHDRLGDDVHHADDLPRRGDLPRVRAAERGHAGAGQRRSRRKGSIFNPNYPRACFARFCQVQRAVDLALRALAPVHPGQDHRRATPRTSHFLAYSGFNEEEGEYWVYLEVDEGSYGGRPGRDGLDSVDCLIANTRNNPIEELEWRFPMRTERYELRDDPCAAGQVARRHRHGARQPLPRRHDRHLRGRPLRVRPAVGHLRRPRRHPRLRQGHDARRRPSSTGRRSSPGKTLQAGLDDRDRRAELGRLRRSARARSRSWCSPTCSTASRPSSSPSATTAS